MYIVLYDTLQPVPDYCQYTLHISWLYTVLCLSALNRLKGLWAELDVLLMETVGGRHEGCDMDVDEASKETCSWSSTRGTCRKSCDVLDTPQLHLGLLILALILLEGDQ